MRNLALVSCLLLLFPDAALAKNRSQSAPLGNSGPVTLNQSNSTTVVQGTITGGNTTGLTVNGSNNTVVNNGTITGTTGVSMTGGSSTVVNSGTIRATSSGTSSSSSVGISISQ